MAEPNGQPTLHHMDNSQSQRILWLLEELEIPYNLELHYREKSGPRQGRSPPELYETHPLGKAPQLVTSTGRIITESAAIASYLITTYDQPHKFQGDPNSRNDPIRDEILTSFAGASLGPITLVKLLLSMAVVQTPFFLRPLVRLLIDAVDRSFTGPELKAMLTYLEGEIEGQEYFMGKEPGRADFMLSFPLDMVAACGWVDLGVGIDGEGERGRDGDRAEFPALRAWRRRCQGREGWRRALGKGNGYDLAFVKR